MIDGAIEKVLVRQEMQVFHRSRARFVQAVRGCVQYG
jgi:hypothetical protein